MSRSAAKVLALVTLFAGLVAADYQFSDNSWTRLAYCNRVSSSALDYDFGRIVQMAGSSTRVRICTRGSTVDCVTSVANSFPIQQLQAGRLMVSRTPNGANCALGPSRIAQVWTGPQTRVQELYFTCSGGCYPQTQAAQESTRDTNFIYHACGNPGGMHFTVNNSTQVGGTRLCSWGRSAGGHGAGTSQLELFVDFPQSTTTPAPTAPTAGPTLAPTPVWDPINVERRVTDLESRLTASVSILNAQISSSNSMMTAQQSSTMTTLTSVAVTADQASVSSQNMWSNITVLEQGLSITTSSMTGLVSRLQSALQSAVDGGGGAFSPPRVSTTAGNNLVLTTGATVQVTSGQCTSNDLCGAASFASALKQALQNM